MILRLEVKDGKMTLPHGQSYELLVLPDQEAMNLEVLKKIERMVKAGAVVTGPKPVRTHGLYKYQEKDRELRELAGRLWGQANSREVVMNKYGKGRIYWGESQKNILRQKGIGPDFSFSGKDENTSLNFIHRKTPVADIYFVRNKNDRPEEVECTFRVSGMIPYLWDPLTGEITEAVRPGMNNLVIDVANVWNNRLVGDGRLPRDQRHTKTQVTRGPASWRTPWKDVPLVESGLIGPVRIMY